MNIIIIKAEELKQRKKEQIERKFTDTLDGKKYQPIENIYYYSIVMYAREQQVHNTSHNTNLSSHFQQVIGLNKVDLNGLKSKAAVMLIQATHFVQSKNLDKARQLFVQIAQICISIKQPDEQVLKWIEISCSCLGILHKNSQIKKNKSGVSFDKKALQNRQNLLYLSYNKFSGAFELSDQQQSFVTQDVLQYISKLNMILFGCQNVESNHSLILMLTLYWMPFLITFVLLILAFIFLGVHNAFGEVSSLNAQLQIPAIIIGSCLLLPMLMIFFKSLEQKDNTFFAKKLGQVINKINEDCKKRKCNIQFLMPHGGQINIRVWSEEEKINALDEVQGDEGEDVAQQDELSQDPHEEQFMDRIKGLTRQISKISGASIASFRY